MWWIKRIFWSSGIAAIIFSAFDESLISWYILPNEFKMETFSLSIDKRIYNNSYSFEFFYNDVQNLIKDFNDTEAGLIQYINIPNVILSGFNCHYERQMNNKNKIKFLFNYTDSYSENSELLSMISKYSLRLNYLHTLIDNQLFLQHLQRLLLYLYNLVSYHLLHFGLVETHDL